MSQSPKSRSWCFTINNYTEQEYESLFEDHNSVKYMIVGKEVGENQTPHLQGYVWCKNQIRMATVKTIVGSRAHLEIAKGNHEQNFKYCSKDGDFKEVGTRPIMPKQKGEMERKRYADAWDLAKAGEMESIDADIRMRYYGTIKRIRHDTLTSRGGLEDTEEQMEWYYGPAGTGKSRKAREENPDAYLKNCNRWWDGYTDQAIVIIEDLDVKHDYLAHNLKHWGDRYAFLAEVKGSSMKIRPRKIIVTSNYHPNQIWTSPSDLEPILRRFKLTHFATLGAVPIQRRNNQRMTSPIDLTLD